MGLPLAGHNLVRPSWGESHSAVRGSSRSPDCTIEWRRFRQARKCLLWNAWDGWRLTISMDKLFHRGLNPKVCPVLEDSVAVTRKCSDKCVNNLTGFSVLLFVSQVWNHIRRVELTSWRANKPVNNDVLEMLSGKTAFCTGQAQAWRLSQSAPLDGPFVSSSSCCAFRLANMSIKVLWRRNFSIRLDDREQGRWGSVEGISWNSAHLPQSHYCDLMWSAAADDIEIHLPATIAAWSLLAVQQIRITHCQDVILANQMASPNLRGFPVLKEHLLKIYQHGTLPFSWSI